MDLQLNNKTAVITGADSGMGLATAAILLAEGARVVIADQDRGRIDAAAATLAGTGATGDVRACVVDVTDLASVEQLRDEAIAHLGHVDCLVNAAGVTGATGVFHEIDDAGWQDTIDVLLMGTVRVVRAFIPHMAARGSGRVVLFASEDSEQPYADEIPYCAAKAGIRALTKGLSKTYAKQGVLINSVGPAFIATPMTDAMMAKRAKENGTDVDEAIASFLKEERPTLELQRRGRAEEVAAVVAFLCSGQASFVNGANYRVDGGSVATL
ncbi:MAG: SDR family oxidoreductase [Gluconacetobacter diazotrophicus]|nr:SDR family oxidoreductase [Gluconacetobacter diazotrophicus]